MCSIAALAIAQGINQVVSIQQQSKAQQAMYQAQADADRQNAARQNAISKQIAEQYAQKQDDLNDKFKLVRGQQVAAQGAAGLQGGVGSGLDLLASSAKEYQQDTINLLTDQRNDVLSSYTQEVNYRNSASANMAAKSNVKKQALFSTIGTILGTASSVQGINAAKAQGVSGGNQAFGTSISPAANFKTDVFNYKTGLFTKANKLNFSF